MITGITTATFAVILLGVLLFRGDAGRVGILVAAACGSVLTFAATIFAVMFDLFGMIVTVASNLANM